MQIKKITRRDILKITAQGLLGLSSLLGLAGLLRYLSFEPDPPPPQQYDIGPASNYPPGSRTLLPNIPALLIHAADGFTALSLTCPHLGCTVEEKSTEMECPCHGSRYTLDGQLLQGPSTKSLPNLPVELTSTGTLIIHKNA